MEVALLSQSSIMIKGKTGSVVVNPNTKAAGVNGVLRLGDATIDRTKLDEGTVIISGPGEYEFAGIKITGIRLANETVFSIRVDRIEILLGSVTVLEKEYTKVKEHNIVILYNNGTVDSSFVTSIATNVTMFYGEKAEETVTNLAKDGFRKETKYAVTFDKLPQEMEKVLLQ